MARPRNILDRIFGRYPKRASWDTSANFMADERTLERREANRAARRRRESYYLPRITQHGDLKTAELPFARYLVTDRGWRRMPFGIAPDQWLAKRGAA